MSETIEHRVINLPCGGTLEIGLSDSFKKKIKEFYSLQESSELSDQQIKRFLFDVTSSAFEKLPAEIYKSISTKA